MRAETVTPDAVTPDAATPGATTPEVGVVTNDFTGLVLAWGVQQLRDLP